MGAGNIVPRNDTSHPAQPLHSAGDGCTPTGCSNSVGIGFPGCVRRSAWRGFAFDSGTRGVSEHLMPRLGSRWGAAD
jgi:hypothetical protein